MVLVSLRNTYWPGRAGAGYFVYVSDAFMLKGDTQTPQREGWTRRTFAILSVNID